MPEHYRQESSISLEDLTRLLQQAVKTNSGGVCDQHIELVRTITEVKTNQFHSSEQLKRITTSQDETLRKLDEVSAVVIANSAANVATEKAQTSAEEKRMRPTVMIAVVTFFSSVLTALIQAIPGILTSISAFFKGTTPNP